MLLPLAASAFAAPIRGYVDLHLHLAAHLAVPVYGAGPDAPEPAVPTARHALRASIHTRDLEEPGPSILVSLAYANPFFTDLETHASMRARIERQLAFVEAYCQRHADRFALAHTPEEARTIVTGGRVAVVHGIEGGTKLLDEPGAAAAWAARGVAVLTPIHLADNAAGGAWCQGGALALLNQPGCRRERRDAAAHGLTSTGRAWVEALVDAGVVVDVAHMSHAALAQTLDLLRARGVAPVDTHVVAAAVSDDPVALTDTEFRGIEALGGLVGVTANVGHLLPTGPRAPGTCPGSVDDLRLHWDHFVALADGAPIAWGSDFQGGVDHLRPRYGPDGCAPAPPHADAFDRYGLANPGLVQPMFDHLAHDGADLAPLDASAERFLELWARARDARRTD